MKEIQRSKEYNERTGKWEMMSFKENKKGHVSVAPARHKALIKAGKERVKYEKEANPDLPSAKKAIRRKGFSAGKAFHLALEQTRRYK